MRRVALPLAAVEGLGLKPLPLVAVEDTPHQARAGG